MNDDPIKTAMAQLEIIERGISERDAEIRLLRQGLRDAIDLAEEGWGYASEYFQNKWGYKDNISEIRRRVGMEGA